jgi:Xaa-Pro aminopeptidase
MINNVRKIQGWLKSTGRSGLVVPTTDEFVSEFAPAPNRRLRWVTGFRGSSGTAVILQGAAALFLDGRYTEQGAADTRGCAISIELATLSSRRAWLKRWLCPPARLAFDPWVHSSLDFHQWRGLAAELGFEIEMLASNRGLSGAVRG